MASSTVDQPLAASISTVHLDIIRTQILTRLGGPTLATASCTSSQLRTLCRDEKLWRDICGATWPSSEDPLCGHVISTFPAGHRSFFADSFPFVDSSSLTADDGSTTTELISAVDLYYNGNLIFSKVLETETMTEWFMSSPLRIDLLDPKESVPTRIQKAPTRDPGRGYDDWAKHLEETLILNWVLIDPTRKRSANLSSRIPVSASRSWLTGEHRIRFATILASSAAAVVMTCTAGEEEGIGGGVHVREVKLHVEDMEGKSMSGRESLVILQGMVEGKKSGEEGDVRGKYDDFVEKKKRLKKMKERKERIVDMASILSGFILFLGFWSFILFR